MITSKLTAKSRTTIPRAVRAALHLKEGDELVYAIEDERVIVMKAVRATFEDPFKTFVEWDSEADRLAYAKL